MSKTNNSSKPIENSSNINEDGDKKIYKPSKFDPKNRNDANTGKSTIQIDKSTSGSAGNLHFGNMNSNHSNNGGAVKNSNYQKLHSALDAFPKQEEVVNDVLKILEMCSNLKDKTKSITVQLGNHRLIILQDQKNSSINENIAKLKEVGLNRTLIGETSIDQDIKLQGKPHSQISAKELNRTEHEFKTTTEEREFISNSRNFKTFDLICKATLNGKIAPAAMKASDRLQTPGLIKQGQADLTDGNSTRTNFFNRTGGRTGFKRDGQGFNPNQKENGFQRPESMLGNSVSTPREFEKGNKIWQSQTGDNFNLERVGKESQNNDETGHSSRATLRYSSVGKKYSAQQAKAGGKNISLEGTQRTNNTSFEPLGKNRDMDHSARSELRAEEQQAKIHRRLELIKEISSTEENKVPASLNLFLQASEERGKAVNNKVLATVYSILHPDDKPLNSEDLGLFTSQGIALPFKVQLVQSKLNGFLGKHWGCGPNCPHLRRFYEKQGFYRSLEAYRKKWLVQLPKLNVGDDPATEKEFNRAKEKMIVQWTSHYRPGKPRRVGETF